MNITEEQQAFPHEFRDGMTLRDYFAAKVMPVLATQFYSLNQQLSEGTVAELVSKVAYKFADAMMKARGQT